MGEQTWQPDGEARREAEAAPQPASLSVGVAGLQRTAGNAAVTRLLARRSAASLPSSSAAAEHVVEAIDGAHDPLELDSIVDQLRQATAGVPSDRSEGIPLLINGPVVVPSYELRRLLAYAESAAQRLPSVGMVIAVSAMTGGAPTAGDLLTVEARLQAAEAVAIDRQNGLDEEQRAALRSNIAAARANLARYRNLAAQGGTQKSAMGGLAIAGTALVADDVSVVGAADDPALVLVGIAALAVLLTTRSPTGEAEISRAWDGVTSPLGEIGEIGTGISMAIQGPRLVGQTRNVARHLARLLALASVGGVPSGEPPKNNNDNDPHWWAEIKASLRELQQAIKGASRKQVMRELLKDFSAEEIAAIEARLAEAARLMGELAPPFLP